MNAHAALPALSHTDQAGPLEIGAIAIGRLVDARIRQLRQLCDARGRFEVAAGGAGEATADEGASLWFDHDGRQWRIGLPPAGPRLD